MRNQGGRKHGERLRRREFFTGHASLRYRSLLDWKERLAGLAVEDEDEPHLGCLGDGGNFPPVASHGDQGRLRRNVVVPDVVVHDLEVPDYLAARGAQRDDRVRVAIVSAPLAAVEVRAGASGRNEDEAALRIGRQDRPGVGGAATVRAVAGPGGARRIVAPARNRVPRPAQGAGARVERAHDAACVVGALVVADRRTDDDEVPDDRGRARHLVVAARSVSGTLEEVDLPAGSEIGAATAGRRIERDQARIQSPDEDPPPARGAGRRSRVEPG